MRKVKTVGSITEFLAQKEVPKPSHLRRYSTVYKVAGATITIILIGYCDVTTIAPVFADSGIDKAARPIYDKLVSVGKWVIVCKGGMDTIKGVGSGDIDSAKKSFLSYLLIYLMLLGLPWAMDEVERLFSEVDSI